MRALTLALATMLLGCGENALLQACSDSVARVAPLEASTWYTTTTFSSGCAENGLGNSDMAGLYCFCEQIPPDPFGRTAACKCHRIAGVCSCDSP